MRARRAVTIAAVLSGLAGMAAAGAQQVATSVEGTTSDYAARREAAMQPAEEATGRRDYATALELYRAVLAQYPKDARARLLTGRAAWAAGSLEEAASDLRAVAEQDRRYGWRERLQVLSIDTALGDWEDFEREDAALHAALAQEAAQAEVLREGYMVEMFKVGSTLVQVMEYPELHGEMSVRYRFSYGPGPDGFERHVDLKSDAGGFALQDYVAAYEQRLIEQYERGEPRYRAARERALAVLEKRLGAAAARPICPYVPVDAQ